MAAYPASETMVYGGFNETQRGIGLAAYKQATQNCQHHSRQVYGGRWQISVTLCADGLPLSAMTAAKHDAICGSATGRRVAADERCGRGRAGTVQFFRILPQTP